MSSEWDLPAVVCVPGCDTARHREELAWRMVLAKSGLPWPGKSAMSCGCRITLASDGSPEGYDENGPAR